MTRQAPKPARLAIMAAGCCILASVIATTAQQGPRVLTPAEIKQATGGATLCGNNVFCQMSRITR